MRILAELVALQNGLALRAWLSGTRQSGVTSEGTATWLFGITASSRSRKRAISDRAVIGQDWGIVRFHELIPGKNASGCVTVENLQQ